MEMGSKQLYRKLAELESENKSLQISLHASKQSEEKYRSLVENSVQ